MQREIKFRAWDKKNDVMRDWDYVRTEWGIHVFNASFEDTTSMMQFTGLHDKNGKEIYEGDILQRSGVVEYKVGGGGGYVGFEFDEMCPPGEDEVIGNVYENPDLLK